MSGAYLSWWAIVRLGLVQTALGAVVVLTNTTLNRIMVVEYALPAMLPGALVAFHYAVQMSRPRWGYGSDVGGRRTPWIIGGMAVLAVGGFLAAWGTALMADSFAPGLVVCIFAFALIGGGVGACGTSLLALLATHVSPRRRPAAASIVWIMMIVGFVVTAATTGQLLDPFSAERLLAVSAGVSAIAFTVVCLAIVGVEPRAARSQPASADGPGSTKTDFRMALAQVWSEPAARRFTIFVFISMLAYSAQDLILEPFAGHVFGMTVGESTQLGATHHGGVLAGMVLVACLGSGFGGAVLGSMRFWAVGGCVGSAGAFAGLAMAALAPAAWPLHANVFALGLANGAFAVAAIGSMMGLAGKGAERREGTRMGLWGAAQAVAFGIGSFAGTAAVDGARLVHGAVAPAYATVFLLEGALFVVSAVIALRVAPAAAIGGNHHEDPDAALLQAAE